MSGGQYQVRVLAVLCSDTDGANGEALELTGPALVAYFDDINRQFAGAGIEFAFHPDFDVVPLPRTVTNRDFVVPDGVDLTTTERPYTDEDQRAWERITQRERSEFASQYRGRFVVFFRYGTKYQRNEVTGVWEDIGWQGGYSGAEHEFAAMSYDLSDTPLFVHETGHYFHLPHTAGDHAKVTPDDAKALGLTTEWPNDPAQRDAVRRLLLARVQRILANEIAGGATPPVEKVFDFDAIATARDAAPQITDTNPDPGPHLLVATGMDETDDPMLFGVESGGVTRTFSFSPDRRNFMSYYFRNGLEPKHFTPDQIARMHWAIEGPRRHLLDFPIPPAAFRNVAEGTWPTGITAITPWIVLGGRQHVVTYSRLSGHLSVDRIDGRSITTTHGEEIGDWTHVTAFDLGAERYLLRYHVESGAGRIDRIAQDGLGLHFVTDLGWSPGWSHVVPLGVEGWGRDHLLVYNQTSGDVRIDRFLPGGAGTENLGRGSWDAGSTHVVPYQVDGPRWRVLVYDSADGRARFDELTDPTTGTRNLFEQRWDPGWTHIMPYPVPATTTRPGGRLVVYRASDGLVHFDQVTDAGTTIVAEGRFDTGWSHFVPVFLTGQYDNSEGMLVYRFASGDVHLDRLY